MRVYARMREPRMYACRYRAADKQAEMFGIPLRQPPEIDVELQNGAFWLLAARMAWCLYVFVSPCLSSHARVCAFVDLSHIHVRTHARTQVMWSL